MKNVMCLDLFFKSDCLSYTALPRLVVHTSTSQSANSGFPVFVFSLSLGDSEMEHK